MRQIPVGSNGIANMYDSIEDAIKSAESPRGLSHREWWTENNSSWLGTDAKGYDDLRKKVRSPWIAGRQKVEAFQSELNGLIPDPVSRARKHRWSDDDGEVDSDRVLRGEAEFYRETYRSVRTGNQHATILVNIGGNWTRSQDSLFYSAAAGIAVIDKLEEAGYTCEVWGYYRCSSVWQDGRRSSMFGNRSGSYMMGLKMKEAGDPVDLDSMITASSSWFFRTVGLTTQDDRPGKAVAPSYGRFDVFSLTPEWKRLFETGNNLVLEMPDSGSASQALRNAREMIEQITAEREES